MKDQFPLNDARERDNDPVINVSYDSEFDDFPDTPKKLAQKEFYGREHSRIERMRGFIGAMKEVEPLVFKHLGEKDSSKFGVNISQSYLFHRRVCDYVVSYFDLDKDSLRDRFLMGTLGLMLSRTVGESDEDDVFFSQLDEVLPLVKNISESQKYIGSYIHSGIVSDDVIVNVRIGLLPSSLRFSSIMKLFRFSPEDSYDWLEWYADMSVNLARDIAFNWDKEAIIKDRETLFSESLRHCADLVIYSWIDHVSLRMRGNSLRLMDSLSVSSQLGELKKAVIDCDVGYLGHHEKSVDWLISQVSEYIVLKSQVALNFGLSGEEKIVISNCIAGLLIDKAPKAWMRASEKAIERALLHLEGMTEEEQEQWSETEGLKPMPLSYFFSELESMTDGLPLIDSSSLSKRELLVSCKSGLARLWGISGAICDIKSKKVRKESE